MLPALSCRTAFAFKRPSDWTMGVLASCWYWEKDQSFGLIEDGLESRWSSLRERKVCWRSTAPERPSPAARSGVRRWKREGLRMRDAIAL